MDFIDFFAIYWLLIKYLIYFAAIVILLSSLDDFFIDCYYWIRRLWRKITVYKKHKPFNVNELYKNEEKPIAIMVPAWQETGVVAEMAALAASTFEYYNYHIFIGTYPNDPDTQAEVDQVVNHYHNVHKVVTRDPGPTSKSDCLNNVIEEIFNFEKTHNIEFEAFVLHDAEDVIHPLELKLFNHLLGKNDLIQVPVVPFERKWYEFTAGHYEDEFAETHGKDMLVRESILGFVPSAGVGTALSRKAIKKLRELHEGQVFILGTLTEDYNLGFELFKQNMKLIFARVPVEVEYTTKNIFGKVVTRKKEVLIAVREFFPSTFATAVRQKSRWIIGIVFQGWKSIGWKHKGIATKYILFRDRKAIFTNLANLLAYFLVFNVLIMSLYAKATTDNWWYPELVPENSFLQTLLVFNAFFLLNRVLQRMYFTSLNFGVRGALLSVPRIIWGNIINIFAMWRATSQVLNMKSGVKDLSWDKTTHDFPVNTTLSMRLGELCLENGLLDHTELDKVLEEQRMTHKPLGMILMGKGILNEEDLTKLLSIQNDLEYIDVKADDLDHSAIKKADPYILLEHDILILKEQNNIQPLVSSGQIVDVVMDNCESRLKNNVELFITKSSTIEEMQHKMFFQDLTQDEFRQLKMILKHKMIPKSIVPQILSHRQETGDDLIASCQYFGFLPAGQLKRIYI